ncbi:hypothetical protein [Saccharibacillus qingshengii]|nr:hypothetical protein [Saccharibacillus qingshengii]
MSIQAGVQLAKRERYHEALALGEEQYQLLMLLQNGVAKFVG